jgi:pimeloyl-ACP methyl ester carboxylesterase
MPYARNGKVNIYYESYGAGEPLVLAHGAGGNAACWWQQIPYFSSRFRVIAFDHRNFARSPCPKEEIGIEHFIGDLKAILDAEEIESTSLICQSLGGWTGLGLTLDSPERVNALVMSHTPGGISNAEIESERNEAMKNLPPLTEPFAHWALAPDFHRKNPEKANLYNQISAFNTRFNIEELLQSMWKPLDASLFEHYSTPTLFVTAEQDQIFPPGLIKKAAALVPGAVVEVLSDGGHSSYFEAPGLFNETVSGFLDSLE